MNSFQTKISGKMMRMRENKNYNFVPFYTTHNRNFQKNSKKIQKIKKNTIMASFQSKIGWKRPRKTENESYRSVSFLSGTKQKIKKYSKKIQKIKKHHYGFI